MSEPNHFDCGDRSSSTQNSFSNFFDWNSEMRLASSSKSSSDSSNTGGRSSVSEPEFIDFTASEKIADPYARSNQFAAFDRDTSPSNARNFSADGKTADSPHASSDHCCDSDNRSSDGDPLDKHQESDRQRLLEQQESQLRRQVIQMMETLIRDLFALAMLCQQMNRDTGSGGGSGRGHAGSGGEHGGHDPAPEAPSRPSAPEIPSTPIHPSTPEKPATPGKPSAPEKPSTPAAPDKPHQPDKSPSPDHPSAPHGSGNSNNDSPSGSKYADTGISRGKTIYRDDFNGSRGEKPNQEIFDTAHIGADGKTRQRGPSIDEDAIISTNNTVQDGHGHLQMFPVRQKTYDPVAKEYVDYTKGSYHTTDGLNFNLKDHPNGIVIEERAKHPTAPGAKFDALWLMTEHWAADPAKGEKQGSTIEYDAAEGGGADITVHYPVKNSEGKSEDHYGGGAHPKDVDIDDGQFHTYTVVIKPNSETGKGDVTEYIDGKKEFSKANVFPADKPIHLKASMEVSPKWTHKTLTGPGGMDSDAAGVIDYLDVSELK